MNFETQVKLAIYHHFAEVGCRPTPTDVAGRVGAGVQSVLEVYLRLRAQRVLALEADGVTIRMAPPFSGVPTQHVVVVAGQQYFANCAWDSLGIIAALQQPGEVYSHCAQSSEPFHLVVGPTGPAASTWLFHCLVPAAHWWDDIVFT
jgi:hypothetical protein